MRNGEQKLAERVAQLEVGIRELLDVQHSTITALASGFRLLQEELAELTGEMLAARQTSLETAELKAVYETNLVASRQDDRVRRLREAMGNMDAVLHRLADGGKRYD